MIEAYPRIRRPEIKRRQKEGICRTIREFQAVRNMPAGFLCRQAGISRASYYKWLNRRPSRREKEDAEILAKIQRINETNNGLFGYRKMTYALNADGESQYNHKRIQRIMSVNGIRSAFRRKKKGTWKKTSPEQIRDNVLGRNFTAAKPNEKWGQDITEIAYGSGRKAYVSTILDLYDRFPVGVTVSRRNDVKLANDTFCMAVQLNGTCELLHSDRGFQYTRKVYQKMLEDAGIQQSMSRVGRCIDNGVVESFQGILKDMMAVLYPRLHNYEDVIQAVYGTYDYYIHYYPQMRFHGKTAYQVRHEALNAEEPIQYPIPRNPRIEKYWQDIQKKQLRAA